MTTDVQTIDWNALHLMSPKDRRDADLICDVYEATLHAVAESVEHENQLMRNGRIDDALALLDSKQTRSVDYARASDLMRRNLVALTRLVPERVAKLKDLQMALVTELADNAKLIATIRSLSENLLRGVAHETHAKTTLTTYGQNGKAKTAGPRASAPAIIVSTQL